MLVLMIVNGVRLDGVVLFFDVAAEVLGHRVVFVGEVGKLDGVGVCLGGFCSFLLLLIFVILFSVE